MIIQTPDSEIIQINWKNRAVSYSILSSNNTFNDSIDDSWLRILELKQEFNLYSDS